MTIDKKIKGNLSEQAYITLKSAIINLELEPGRVLYEDELSKMLGISRTPIRSALQRLSYEDLVISSSKGASVSALSTESFFEIYSIRESLELLSIRDAAVNRTKADVNKMEDILKEQVDVIESDSLNSGDFLRLDRQLHLIIAKSSKNQLLLKYLLQINELFNRYLYYTKFNHRARNVVNEHIELVNSIKLKDSYLAERIMVDHLRGVKESILLALIQ